MTKKSNAHYKLQYDLASKVVGEATATNCLKGFY